MLLVFKLSVQLLCFIELLLFSYNHAFTRATNSFSILLLFVSEKVFYACYKNTYMHTLDYSTCIIDFVVSYNNDINNAIKRRYIVVIRNVKHIRSFCKY